MKKVIVLSVLFLIAVSCKAPDAPEKYRYQTKRMDLPYTDFKADQAAAEKKASLELDFYSKETCREMGYGWALDKIEDPGIMSCEETAEGHHCRKKQVALVCRQRDDR